MNKTAFFPQKSDSKPIIYAYSDTRYPGCLKIGFTTRNVIERMKEHYPTITPTISYKVEFIESAMYPDGSNFTDHDIHRYLNKHGFKNVGGEWYKCSVNDVRAAWIAVLNKTENEELRTLNFKMRPEQERAVDKTIAYFESIKKENYGIPKFLWNCKMRFGKTFATYQLAKKMGFSRILILTFKPAVQSAWEEDLRSHIDFVGWQFVSREGMKFEETNKSKPIVCFGSFQDYLGVTKEGHIKPKNEWVHEIQWDLVVFDEYHYGAWNDNSKKLFAEIDEEKDQTVDFDHNELLDETWLPITSNYYLYLSGTPFRAINSGEFIEEQVFNWTYSDEQSAKANWEGPNNPYEALPRIVLMTYKIPESIRKVALNTEFNEFDLNEFFSAEGTGNKAKFIHENEVQKWIDLIRGGYDISIDELKVGTKRGQSYLPFKETALLNILNHTLWFLPNVASCFAMANLLKQRQNTFYHSYMVNVCAGTSAGVGLAALKPVLDSMDNPLESKTITLTCGKLTTGVTVKPWTGIFMLRNLSSPETYFQSAFRVQSPWTISKEDGSKDIIKQECYVFDFSLDRALKQIADYATKLDVNESNPEKKVADFINFLPVLAYQDGMMQQIDAAQILDIALSGTTASLLARRWESALLVNVDNATLERVLNNPKAMEVLMKIEGFRSLNKDITTIITKSNEVKKSKKENPNPTPKEKKQLTEEEKEYKSKRKQIQEKLIKFATRIPVFMYLTDFREYTLKDVITKLEPALFKKVTGLQVEDFNLLVSLGIFNEGLMNDAVFHFKRYEDSSLSYVGINKHEGEKVGGFSTVISDEEYMQLYGQQQLSLDGFKKQTKKIDVQPQHKTVESNPTHIEKPLKSPEKEEHSNVILKPVEVTQKESKTSRFNFTTGLRVIHKAFGEGIIVNLEQGKLYVKFNDPQLKDAKIFQYPQAFENGFLKIMN